MNSKSVQRQNGLASLQLLVPFFAFLMVSTATSFADEFESWPYHVQRGDTLYSISVRYLENKSEWRKIQQVNKLKNPNRIESNTRLLIPTKLLKQEATSATIAFVEGSTQLRPLGETAERRLSKGDQVRQGDQIRTGANATTTIDFVDGSQLVILRDSIVTFVKLQGRSDAKLASIQIDLKQGRVETRVTPRKNNNSRYDIFTPTVQIGVRGTEFRVNAGDGSLTRTEVLEGKIAAENSLGSTTVPMGFGTVIEKNKAPQPPVALLAAPKRPDLLYTPTSVSARWNELSDAKNYRIVIASNQSFSQLVGEYVTSKQEIQLAPLAPGRYFLRLRGIDSNGLEGRASERAIDI